MLVAGRYTLLDQSALNDLLPAVEQRGVSVLAVGIFNSGILAEKYPRSGATYNYRAASDEVLERAQSIAKVCVRHGTDLPTAAIHFPLAHRTWPQLSSACEAGKR